MKDRKALRRWLIPLGSGVAVSLAGCSGNFALLDPKGSVGAAEKSLIATATGAMLLVVVPVILLTLFFAWRYRASNRHAVYAPKWAHSTAIEVVVWTIPAIIILFLGVLTWKTTHELDPYKPLESNVKPINVEVVALDWKWLFIYPDLGIATVNQLAVPVGTPVNFRITSDSVMNSFFIPQLGTQVYAMAGMQTRLHLIADEAGTFVGRNSQYSGGGYSQQHFEVQAMSQADFDAWVARAKQGGTQLDATTYPALAAKSRANPITYYSTVEPKLFDSIIDKYRHSGHAHSAPVRR